MLFSICANNIMNLKNIKIITKKNRESYLFASINPCLYVLYYTLVSYCEQCPGNFLCTKLPWVREILKNGKIKFGMGNTAGHQVNELP